MGYTNIKDEIAIGNAALGLLERDTMLAGTVWRDAVADFAGKKDDTVSIRLPAYAVANKRTLRQDQARARRTLVERKVDITLNADLQIDVPLTDENQTLDIESITRQVVAPSVGAILRGIDTELATAMGAASYEKTVEWDATDPYASLVEARIALDDHQVPATDRFLVVGSEFLGDLLNLDLLKQVDTSGSSQTLRNGVVGTVATFNVLTSPFLAGDEAYAYHRTAFALASRAPVVPRGVAWGTSQASGGFAIRVMEHLSDDANGDLLNLVYHDTWIGVNVVTDNGDFNADGKFVPSVANDEDDMLVRAVKFGDAVSS